ncbi:MAG: ABC transporter ATP-binding protein [Caulobacteraceae bacterium]
MIKNVKYYLNLILEYKKSLLFLFFIRLVVLAFEPYILIFTPKYIINALFVRNNPAEAINYAIIMLAIYIPTHLLMDWLNSYIEVQNNIFKENMHKNLALKCTRIPYEKLENSNIQDSIEKAKFAIDGSDKVVSRESLTSKGIDSILNDTSAIISGVINILINVYMLLVFNVWFLILLVVLIIVNSFVGSKSRRNEYDFRVKTTTAARRLKYAGRVVLDNKKGKEIRIFNMSDFLISKLFGERRNYMHARRELRSSYFLLNCSANILQLIQKFSGYIYVAYNCITGIITIGDFFLYYGIIENFNQRLTSVFESLINIRQNIYYLDDYRSVMEMEECHYDELTDCELISFNCIEFSHVWFKYPNSKDYTLKDINIRIEKGARLSIVGPNGAGKTTFIKLLLRLYEPTEGAIYIDGINIRDIPYAMYNKMIASLFQENNVLPFTAEENISMSSSGNEYKIKHALAIVGLLDKFDNLPKKTKAYVTRLFSNDGIELSGGEQQKLMFCRLLYKDCDIYILDEPTASLDPRAEYMLYKDFNKIMHNKTVIFISHRLSSCRICDYIAVFNEGKICEYGTHDSLYKQGGLYYKLYQTQAQYYID